MTARLFTLDPVEGFRPKTFAGHKDAVLGAYFSADGKTVSTYGPHPNYSNIYERSTPSVAMVQYSLGKQNKQNTNLQIQNPMSL